MQTVLGRALWVGNKMDRKGDSITRNVWDGGREGSRLLFPASASPAALIDVPCITAAMGAWRKEAPQPPPPPLEQGQQPDVPGLGELGWGQGYRQGQPPGCRALLPPSLGTWTQVVLALLLTFGQWSHLLGT